MEDPEIFVGNQPVIFISAAPTRYKSVLPPHSHNGHHKSRGRQRRRRRRRDPVYESQSATSRFDHDKAKKKYPPLRPAVTLDVERQLPFDCTSGSNELWYSNDLLNNEHASHATTKSTPPQRPSPTKDRKKAEHPFTSLSGSCILLVAHDFDDRRKQG